MNSEILLSFLITIPTWVMLLPIGICSIICVAVVIERLVFFKLTSMSFSGVVKSALFLIRSHDFDAALVELAKSPSYVTRIFSNYLEMIKHKDRDKHLEEMSHIAQKKIERFLGAISTIATISPMFGLLGTVTGMMKSFSALSTTESSAQNLLAYGIAEALVTTATGLLVAIPAVMLYNYMVSRSAHLLKELEMALNALVEVKK